MDLCADETEEHFHPEYDGTLVSLTSAADYTIERFLLNRPQLVELRYLLWMLLKLEWAYQG